MIEGNKYSKLIVEEKKTVILFLWLFYIIFFSYELFTYFFYPKYEGLKQGLPESGLGYWFYVLILALLPIGIYLLKKANPYSIKYLYFISFNLLDFFNNLIIFYKSNEKNFQSGNAIEIFFVLFTPVFVNKKYYWLVSGGMIVKYILYGVIFDEGNVTRAIVLLALFSGIAFIQVQRWSSYVLTIKNVCEELRQKEKLAVIGQMAAAIGHEIRNPLSSLKGFTQLQQEKFPNRNDFYPIMIQEIDRINSIVNDLMYLGKPREIKYVKASIEEIIAYTLSITKQQAERQGVTVETLMTEPLPLIDCDEKQLKQVFINLIKNAIESMSNGGKIRIYVKVYGKNNILISIQDEGCGIKDENFLNIGAPFYTTKKDGTGLGALDISIKLYMGNNPLSGL